MPNLVLKPPKRVDPLEAWHQEMLIRTAALHEKQYPALKYLFAIPNGGFRHETTAAAMRRGGVKKGVPDLCLPVPRGGYVAWWCELKRYGGVPSDLSDEQKKWLAFLTAEGAYADWHKGWEAAWASLLWYLSLPPTAPRPLGTVRAGEQDINSTLTRQGGHQPCSF